MKNFNEVIVYSSTTWPPCKQMKEFLSIHSIVFEEKLIDQDPEALTELVEKTGIRGTPVLIAGEDIVVGFDKSKIQNIFDLN